MRRRHDQTEVERAEQERERLAELEQPQLDPARDCTRCFGSGFEQYRDEDNYNRVRKCDHLPVPF